MAESCNLKKPQLKHEIAALKEALNAQQELLQQLYGELDAEREASATAASEALAMILRLQGEKASLKMEASQYKRMAEEKICHAEEALAVFEDLIYQREVEIATLEFEVQAYRCRLIRSGCNDLGANENKFPENLSVQRNSSTVSEECSVQNSIHCFSFQSKTPGSRNVALNQERWQIFMLDSVPGKCEEFDDLEKKPENPRNVEMIMHRDRIRNLDSHVKEILGVKESSKIKPGILQGSMWSPSFSLTGISSPGEDQTRKVTDTDFDSETCQEMEVNVQDIYAVPESIKSHETRGSSQGKQKSAMLDIIDEHKIEKTKCVCSSSGIENKLAKPTIAAGSWSKNQQLSKRIEQLEGGYNNIRQEIGSNERAEEVNMLKEIREQLKCIQSEMRRLRVKESVSSNEPSLAPLQEAMLYFWV